MFVLAKAMYSLGTSVAVAGLILVVVPFFGLRRIHGFLAICLGVGFMVLAPQLSVSFKARLAADAAAKARNDEIAAANNAKLNAAQPVRLTKDQMLANLRIDGLSWETAGFGNVMVATFIVNNNNPVSVRDVEISCGLSGGSGTIINVNKRTIYESIDRKSYLSVRDMNMGFINSQADRSKCIVTDFKS
jgi:hypothetical protein